jgi:HD superfamily phosphohydrolase
MHELHIYHFDVKPANILVSEKSQGVMLTDMGSCIHADVIKQDKLRVHFTWTYAHPLLTTIVSHPQSISGGGLKASGEIVVKDHLARFDLFAFGKTIQEALAIIENEFGERCHASYGFRFLHIIACLLLDGFNSPAKAESRRSQIVKKDGRSFVKDVALDYPPEIFEQNKITSALELTERLARFGRDYSWNAHTPELDRWQPETINAQLGPAPFTERVSQLFNHRCLRRLKRTYHLGWMKEIFPGATHDRWTHSLGVFSSVVSYYNSLLADPAVPTFRILADGIDFEHAFTAAILHDLGQSTFGHDLEEACPQLFSHEDFLFRLLDEPFFGDLSLAAVLQRYWPRVSLSRLKSILQRRHRKTSSDHADTSTIFRMVDGVAADAIDGPIDADKFDYLLRDSTGCGVPYGHGMDRPRFLQALTVGTAKIAQDRFRLTLAYKAKGRPAIESLLLARYQMYGAIYWHHTYRCIQSMFVHAAASTFSESSSKSAKRLDTNGLQADTIHEVLYHRVICGKTWTETQEALNPHQAAQLTKLLVTAPSLVAEEPVLDFVWQFASPGIRDLIERLGARKLYKRIFEITVAELGSSTNYSELKSELSPAQRLKKAEKIQKRLLDEALNSMRKRGATETASETAAKERHKQLLASNVPLVTLDFPTRGIGKEKNLPSEIGDPARKYSTLAKQSNMPDNNVFQIVRELHERIATIRVFAAPECHELLIRYLTPDQIRQCVASVIDQIPES